jgi:hypothetical protein
MWHGTRRDFLQTGAAGLAACALGAEAIEALAQLPGERPPKTGAARVLNPLGRVPVSLIIDDSTCLVNLAHFAMPQFAEVWPNRKEYQKPWRQMPREIPDAFVRKFALWCREHGVKGKYSIVPYPACVGWLDRDLPGWAHRELLDSLELVRREIVPDWDIHPEMVSHTWVIDTKTGRPYPERSARFMENWGWTAGKSADQLADYMAYALRILKNVGLPCEGITTPGGFGSQVLPELAEATLQACRDVYQTEIPHYFRHAFTDARSVAPRVEYASGLDGPSPRCVVSIVACTDDWFGGWDASSPGSADRLITADLTKGRMVEVIDRGEPAIMACHWPGIYYNGQEVGFRVLQEAVRRLHARYDRLIWMTLSEIARYWAAKELTRIEKVSEPPGSSLSLRAPFACPRFTLAAPAQRLPGYPAHGNAVPKLTAAGKPVALAEVARPLDLKPGTWTRDKEDLIVCFDLPKGRSQLEVV